MAFRQWQVGVDIQNGSFCALAIQRHRRGWQLRHWWQHSLPQDLLFRGRIQSPSILIAVLQKWRKLLPNDVSIRVGFPPQAVLQHCISEPVQRLCEPMLGRYVTAVAEKTFPVNPANLAFDYRVSDRSRGQLFLTATHTTVLTEWLNCLEKASLTPDVLELTLGGLSSLAQSIQFEPNCVLVHQIRDHWLWHIPDRQIGKSSGWCSNEGIQTLFELQRNDFPDIKTIYFSTSLLNGEEPYIFSSKLKPLFPLRALQYTQQPLPDYSGAFTIATGLALRPRDA